MLLLERLPRWITRSRIISVVFFTFKKLLIKVLINILHERKKCGKTWSILKSAYEENATSVTLELIKRSSMNPIKTNKTLQNSSIRDPNVDPSIQYQIPLLNS